ncbi:MAG: cobalt-precorrin-5B (C(1))-methyltransferase CbiD [Desulfovibrio sp.]|nr:cobalt-precorrin-5B (C(1))-methyltransferase CbiD [Desulfovibrio sp.]
MREGFTTGSAACAAALAALEYLLTGQKPQNVSVPLPPIGQNGPRAWLAIRIASVNPKPGKPEAPSCTTACVIKDAGDDPDVTHQAEIWATLTLYPRRKNGSIRIRGAKGVGRVTLPGLPLPVGAWAINPVPRQQIRFALKWRWQELAKTDPCAMTVVISVPDGERLAPKTFNPRLGILGGLSILGTQGTVKAFSHAAFAATIAESVSVARALHLPALYFATGRRSEELLRQHFPKAPLQAFIQAADFVAYALLKARCAGFETIVWGCFFGKLVKMAQSHGQTHARRHLLDFASLAHSCAEAGPAVCQAITKATTAREVLELLLATPKGPKLIAQLTQKASEVASHFARRPVQVFLFHLDGRLLAVFPGTA